MKRFWKQAGVVREDGHYAIRLDGKPMRLPGGPVLALDSLALAQAIAAEWQDATDVPMTRLAGTAQERVAHDPAPTVAALARYGEADLLCYRADAPAGLVERQAALWQPWLDWVRDRYGAALIVTSGILHVTQPPSALEALRAALKARPPFELAGLAILVPALGSLVLGLAVADGAVGAEEAHGLAMLDELFQAETWGEDREAVARRRAVGEDVQTAARFIRLSRPGSSG